MSGGNFSLASFGAHLAAVVASSSMHEKEGLEHAAEIIKKEAKRVIGTYDYDWTPLAASTVARKKNGDTPLLETGAMRSSIEHMVQGRSAFVGSNSDIAVYQEMGTAKIPARSFLAKACIHKGEEVADAVAKSVLFGLINA